MVINFLYKYPFLHMPQILKVRTPSGTCFLRSRSADIITFWEVFQLVTYDFDYPQAPRTIVDAGANIGLATLYFKSRFPDSRIIAIEPENSNYEMLLKNTANLNSVDCLNAGLWNKSCRLQITNPEAQNNAFIVQETDDLNGIPAVSIPDIMQQYNLTSIDILKMDIEGSEKFVLDKDSDKWLSKVKVLVIELHDRFFYGPSQSLVNALQPFEFSLFIKHNNIAVFFSPQK